jgi:hypothetical protein
MPRETAQFRAAIARVHPHAWLWQPLEADPTFVLRSMFGAKAAYLGGRLMLCFCSREEPWRGVLVCTDRSHHVKLREALPALVPHPVLPKWLYLSEGVEQFEPAAIRLVEMAQKRDPRLGILPRVKKAKAAAKKKSRQADHP